MEAHDTLAVSGGFSDPVLGSQAAFRKIMDAFARPGTIADLGDLVTPPDRLPVASAAILATLADADASVFLEIEEPDAAAAWIAFQTGAAIVDEPAAAAFAVLGKASEPAAWGCFSIGTDAYPDRSATLLLEVDALDGGAVLTLSGPGIESSIRVSPRGLPAGFLEARTRNAALYPCGQDLVLVAGARCMALPRTTLIEEV